MGLRLFPPTEMTCSTVKTEFGSKGNRFQGIEYVNTGDKARNEEQKPKCLPNPLSFCKIDSEHAGKICVSLPSNWWADMCFFMSTNLPHEVSRCEARVRIFHFNIIYEEGFCASGGGAPSLRNGPTWPSHTPSASHTPLVPVELPEGHL